MSGWGRIAFLALFFGISTQLIGCATVFTGTSDTVYFESEPSGATVLIEGLEVGKTPLSIPVDRETFTETIVTIRRPGYEPRTFVLRQDFNGVYVANVFFWPGFIIDAATGSLKKYSPRRYAVTLEPSSPRAEQ